MESLPERAIAFPEAGSRDQSFQRDGLCESILLFVLPLLVTTRLS